MDRQVRCTDCSRKVDPVVSIDIDGVLGDYHGHFVVFAQEYLGSSMLWGYDGSIEFSEYLKLDKQIYRDMKLAYRQGGQKRSLPVYQGAVSFMNSLKDEIGVELWIATTRPYMRLDNIDPDTRFWLERHKIPYDHILYGDDKDDKYGQLISQVDRERVIAVIDDLVDQCFHAEAKLQPRNVVIQPIRPHNRGAPYKNQFNSFDDALSTINERADVWRDRHESR